LPAKRVKCVDELTFIAIARILKPPSNKPILAVWQR